MIVYFLYNNICCSDIHANMYPKDISVICASQFDISGCGSVWLERHLREVEAASSNLVTPIKLCICQSFVPNAL